MSKETNTPDFELRMKQRRAIRVNRNKLFLLSGAILITLILLISWSFVAPTTRIISEKELLKPQTRAKPEGIDKLPASYDDIRTKKRKPNTRQVTSKQDKLDQSARTSGLFFKVKETVSRRSANPKNTGQLVSQLNALSNSLDQRIVPVSTHKNGIPANSAQDPNYQFRKHAFLQKKADGDTINTHSLKRLNSPYTLMAGTVIAASLITGLNSDLPGQVLAQITEPVYNSVSGKHLLIPQGSRLIGAYDSMIAFAQKRALIKWQRIILPNGSSIQIDNLPATDPSGYTGLKDRIDYHSWSLIKGIALATLISVGTELALPRTNNDLITALREATQGNITKASDSIIKKHLEIQPTLKVRPGWPLRIIVNKDLIMEPASWN